MNPKKSNNPLQKRSCCCTLGYGINSSQQRLCALEVAFHLFHKTYPMGMVTSDDASAIDGIQETNSVQSRDDNVEFANNHYFDSAIINHKLQGLNLSDQKLMVLQDAAKRMVQRHEDHIKKVQQQHSSQISASVEECKEQNQKEIKKLTEAMERRLQHMDVDRNKAINELKKTKQEYTKLVETERTANRVKLEGIHSKYKLERENWIEAERQLLDELDKMKTDANVLVGNATLTIQRLDMDVRQQKEKYRSVKEKYDTLKVRYHHATTEIEEFRSNIRNLESDLELERQNMSKLQQHFNERMEIAESSVTAATNRENILQANYDSLQQSNDSMRQEISRLNQELQQQTESYMALNNTLSTKTTRIETSILSNSIQRIRKYIWYNDRSLLRVSCRWIKAVFVPNMFPFHIFPKRRIGTKHSDER
jgi:chromosome segregation ATPase